MTNNQTAIFNEQSSAHYFLEYNLDKASLPQIKEAYENCQTEIVLPFGLDFWQSISTSSPKDLRSFKTLDGLNAHSMPSTQADRFIWLHGEDESAVVQEVLRINQLLSPKAQLVSDLRGFKFQDSRDLTGFVDGSANPKDEKRQEAALIAEGEFAGGSFVMTQKWLHKLEAFAKLSQLKQEQVIGRTKPDSIELEGEAMPSDSHVSRTDVKVDGKGVKIYRRSLPFGSAAEHGLFFLAFASDLGKFDIMLERMLGITEDGIQDKIMNFSTAVTGSYSFAPSENLLKKVLVV